MSFILSIGYYNLIKYQQVLSNKHSSQISCSPKPKDAVIEQLFLTVETLAAVNLSSLMLLPFVSVLNNAQTWRSFISCKNRRLKAQGHIKPLAVKL